MNSSHGGKRKKLSDIDLQKLLSDAEDDLDDPLPEIVITISDKSNAGTQTEKEDTEYQNKTDDELKATISKNKNLILTLGRKLRDNGDKLKATIRRCEAEVERREKTNNNKCGIRCEETIQISDQSNDGAFANSFIRKMDEDNSSRTLNAFQEEFFLMNPRQGRNMSQSGLLSSRARSSQQLSSRSKPFGCPTSLANTKKPRISKSDKKISHSGGSATFPLHHYFRDKAGSIFKKLDLQDQPPTKSRPKIGKLHKKVLNLRPISFELSSYHLVDEDIEEPDVCNLTLFTEELSGCMKEIKVYYPSRDDQDPVEVIYTDMECLAPSACLSSTIMNFYIRYLQQRSSENTICNYHFFNTYFYNKLQKLNYSEDSFFKFRKWWKRINIFKKAYILLPVHENAHWSLGIICIPTKEDELGPIVLHLDSLGLHDSKSISDNIRRFLKKEWGYLQKSEDRLDLPITDEIWENLDDRIIDRKMLVPQQKNLYDCGLFVLFYMERFIKEAPERLAEKDLSMFSKQWFRPEEASNLRATIHNLLVQEFKMAKEKETAMSPKC